MLAFLVFAVEGSADEGSKTAFYVAAGALAVWAVLVGGLGVARPAFAQGEGASRIVMTGTFLLVVATMATAILTSS